MHDQIVPPAAPPPGQPTPVAYTQPPHMQVGPKIKLNAQDKAPFSMFVDNGAHQRHHRSKIRSSRYSH